METLQAAALAWREVVARWLVLAELEARDAATRVVLALAMAVAIIVMMSAAWIFAAAAAVATLVAGGASLVVALLVVGGLNVLLAGIAMWVLWRCLRQPWFEAARRQLGLSVAPFTELEDARLTH